MLEDFHGSTQHRIVGKTLLYAISCFASVGVFLFINRFLSNSLVMIKGLSIHSTSSDIHGPYFKKYFNQPLPYEVGTMVAVLEIGAFITSLAAGRIADIIGRRKTLFWGAVVFAIGGAFQTGTTGYAMMVFGRIISGFGVGLLSTIVPIYQSEVSPAEHWIDYFCSFIESDLSWRLPLFNQCIIGAILAIGSLFMPESPRWLIDVGREKEGLIVIADLYGGDLDNPKAREEFREIVEVVEQERISGDRTYAAMWARYKYRVLIAMSSQAFAQLNGINVISYYAPLVFEQAGWIGRDALLMTGINAIIYVASTIPTWFLVDWWGRPDFKMMVALITTGYWMKIDVPMTPNAVVACVIIFNAAFGYSWGPVPWLYPPEIMPLAHRAKGVSLSTATNWLFNWLVGQVTPVLQSTITWRLYPMHGFFCACSFVLVYFLYPETKGVPLEEMDRVFGEEPFSDGDESERASLVRSGRQLDRMESNTPREHSTTGSWYHKFFGSDNQQSRSGYQPVESRDED
ncbi:hypothetical protein Clacol_003016 [Clathrus columnatus]|uniref:Major facilitator superfamily (MFS) profile domain-containing protein n=1 Tax=Clathrus columnatus TaxID=1419009 RepID=A0AAV5A579_9AGAM|nr:hypothetical protein Clacol_003016 [Clathrus columnatus]